MKPNQTYRINAFGNVYDFVTFREYEKAKMLAETFKDDFEFEFGMCMNDLLFYKITVENEIPNNYQMPLL